MKFREGHLTARQKLFCEHYVGAGKHCAALAARLAGYASGCSHVTGCQLLQKPKIAARVGELEAEASRSLGLTRKDVMAELVGAADLARLLREPGAMISAWKQVALMAGFYEPEEFRAAGLKPEDAAMRARYEAMSDEELIALTEGTV